MALATYGDLQTAVASWLARAGDSVVTGSVADYITLCEARLAYGSGDAEDADATFYTAPLRIRAMEKDRVIPVQAAVNVTTVTGTNSIALTPQTAITSYAAGQTWSFTAAGNNTGPVTCNISGLGARNLLQGSGLSALASGDIVGGQTVQMYDDGAELIYLPGTASAPLPMNYLAMRSMYLDSNRRVALSYETPTQANLLFSPTETGRPKRYTIEGDAIRLDRTPDTGYYLVCLYYQKFGALSSATNWLMTNAPNVYLFGSLLEAAIMLQMSDEGTQRYLRLFRAACNGVQNQDTGDRHSGGLLTIRNDTQNP